MIRPKEMRGRTAFYGEHHVLQVVAIKRLQGQDMTLSDIQSNLLGITPAKLRRLAALPSGFWEDADRYLNRPAEKPGKSRSQADESSEGGARQRANFWATAPQLSDANVSLSRSVNLVLRPGVTLSINLSEENNTHDVNTEKIEQASVALIAELIRQGFLPDDSNHSSTGNTL